MTIFTKNKFIFKIDGKTIVLDYLPEEKKVVRNAKKNHYLGKYRGFCFNKEIIDYLIGKIKKIEIKYNNRCYLSNVEDWQKKGKLVEFKGFGKQYVLESKLMMIYDENGIVIYDPTLNELDLEIAEGLKRLKKIIPEVKIDELKDLKLELPEIKIKDLALR